MSDSVVLAVDTSMLVAAGVARGSTVLGSGVVEDRMQHVEQLMPLVARVLAEAKLTLDDVDRIVVGLGPGPFTGLRVGVATAQVIAAARNIPLRGICTLDVLAAQHARERPSGDHTEDFVVASDARRKEVYWARYAATGTRIDGPRVSLPEEVPALPTVGPGADLYADRLAAVLGPRRLDAGLMAVHGWDLPDEGTEPLYLRRPDAAEPSRRKSTLLQRTRPPRGERPARGKHSVRGENAPRTQPESTP